MKQKYNYMLKIMLILLTAKTVVSEESKVTIKYAYFNETNFEEFRTSHENILIYFTANWSADSQNKKQNFLNIREGLLDIKKNENNKDNFIVVGEANSKSYKLCHDFNIKKYPSVMLISGNRQHLYKGEIEAEHILEWLRK